MDALKLRADEPDVALQPCLGNWVGGPGDYRCTEWLAADSLAWHSSWVYNKVGVVTPLSAWAHYNCDAYIHTVNQSIESSHTLI